jgi:hypothetical protein
MWPQCAGLHLLAVCRQHGLLGTRFGLRIISAAGAHPSKVVRRRFVDAALIAACEHHARAARVYEPPNSLSATVGQDQFRAQLIHGAIGVAVHADARQCRHVEHTIGTRAGCAQRIIVANIAAHHLDALLAQLRIFTAAEAPHAVAARDERFNDIAAQESAATGDQCVH